ncbi:SRPBCC family protein [Deinococcus hopiensis]|uniref:Polyketide cyclase / dehydrase and lipid transport n=1 Tax=Deinococcus hopiensis KR-140 TaxID=695939 RepID=A0A1W1UT12_9DEIO|nr:SRPBCC family protein [Deinococcus hopiensis]SMB84193.1 Polyketide cyclase / dehydrase and lipid transport [Deinococcus hopiensis KR-140]
MTTTAKPEHIYALWADVQNWPRWNADVVQAKLTGPFAVDSHINMMTANDTLSLRLDDVQENTSFTDEVAMEGLGIRTVHALRDLPNGQTEISYRLQIEGANADQLGPEIGPAITGDFPATIAALVRLAEAEWHSPLVTVQGFSSGTPLYVGSAPSQPHWIRST